ncbi:hypothetical protein J2S09_005651 [Bacillus fengqiuensis]|nr:hypothetical protein [Bacillus fengqiuensis]
MKRFDLIVKQELQLLEQHIRECFSLSFLEQLARETGFIRRKRKWGVREFVSLCVFLSQQISTASLTELCQHVYMSNHLLVSTESLNQKFNTAAVELMKRLVAHLLHKNHLERSKADIPEVWELFKRIKILDSTGFPLHPAFTRFYRGTRRSSEMRVQLEYEVISSSLSQIELTEGIENDNTYGQQHTNTIEAGDLSIRDLGYLYFPDFKKMDEKGAYYVSRLRLNSRVYRKEGEVYQLIDIQKELAHLEEGECIEWDDVYVGAEHKLPTRVVIYKLTEEEYQQRGQSLKKVEQRKRKTFKKKTKERSEFSLLITNLPSTKVSASDVYKLYSIRWRIEIVFKTWKSLMKIHACKPVKLERFLCHVYGQLIALLLQSTLLFRMHRLLWRKRQKEVSLYKATYMFRDYLPKIYDALFGNSLSFPSVLFELWNFLEKNGALAHRYRKKSVFDILYSI